MNRMFIYVFFVGAICPFVAIGADGIKAGDEFALLAGGPGNGIQAAPAVAFGEGICLAVWREGWHGKGGSARIYATRVSPDGKVLDPAGIEVAPADVGVQERPRVAFGGGTFLVVWQDLRNAKDYDVFGARITPDGKVHARKPIAVAAGPHNQVLPDVAGDGKSFIVVWQGFDVEKNVFGGYATQVAADGAVGRTVETGIVPQPKISWNGTCYLAICGGHRPFSGTVKAVRLGSDAAVQGKPMQVITGTKDAAFSISHVPERGWLVVSHRSRPDPWGWGGPGAIRAALVNSDGRTENEDAVKEPAGVKQRLPGWLDMGLAKTEGATWPWGPNASAFDGKQTVVVWQRHHLCGEKWTNFENCDIIAARVSGYQSRDPKGVPVAASTAEEHNPALASCGEGQLLLIYERREDNGRVVVAARCLWTQ